MRLFLALFTVFIVGGLLAGGMGVRILAEITPAVTGAPSTSSSSSQVAASVPADSGTPQSRTLAQPAQPPQGPTSSTPTVPWSLLYVVDGDLWLTTQGQSTQLTQDGEIGQPAFGDNILAWVEHAKDGSDVWAIGADAGPHSVTRDMSTVISQNVWAGQPVFVPGVPRAYVLSDYNKDSTGVGDLAIWELDLVQGTQLQITHPPAYTGGDQDVTVNPADPRQIVFTRYVYAGTDMVEALNWLDLTEGNALPLTDQNHPSRQASFSPDGTELAFVQPNGQDQDLYVADLLITGGQPKLANVQQIASGMIAEPTWSPDGHILSYTALSNNAFQVWTAGVQRGPDGAQAAGQAQQVTAGTGVDATSRAVWLTNDQASTVRQWFADATS